MFACVDSSACLHHHGATVTERAALSHFISWENVRSKVERAGAIPKAYITIANTGTYRMCLQTQAAIFDWFQVNEQQNKQVMHLLFQIFTTQRALISFSGAYSCDDSITSKNSFSSIFLNERNQSKRFPEYLKSI